MNYTDYTKQRLESFLGASVVCGETDYEASYTWYKNSKTSRVIPELFPHVSGIELDTLSETVTLTLNKYDLLTPYFSALAEDDLEETPTDLKVKSTGQILIREDNDKSLYVLYGNGNLMCYYFAYKGSIGTERPMESIFRCIVFSQDDKFRKLRNKLNWYLLPCK